VSQNGRCPGTSPALSVVRTCRVLRLIQEQARHQALPRDETSLVRSIEPGEAWIWCYVDNIMAGELDF